MGKVDLNARIKGIASAAESEANAALSAGDPAEAKRAFANAIRDLRDYKRELTEAERRIREQGKVARERNSQSGQTIGMFVNSKARGAMARSRAAEGRRITARQTAALAPYATAKSTVDRVIAGLDRARAEISDTTARDSRPRVASTAQVAQAAPSAPPPPPTPAMWAADPSGRHEHRYWDGTRWTEHVASHGQTSIDPLDR